MDKSPGSVKSFLLAGLVQIVKKERPKDGLKLLKKYYLLVFIKPPPPDMELSQMSKLKKMMVVRLRLR